MCRRSSFSTEKALQVNCPPVGSMKALQASFRAGSVQGATGLSCLCMCLCMWRSLLVQLDFCSGLKLRIPWCSILLFSDVGFCGVAVPGE